MFHASPQGAPANQFIEGSRFHAQELTNAFIATGHLLKDMGSEIFGVPILMLSLGTSTGVQRGNALFAGSQGAPFDGYVMVVGGSGLVDRLNDLIHSFSTDERLALTCLFTNEKSQNHAQRASTLADRIRMADPDYSDLIRNELPNGEAAYTLALNYHLEERPQKVQQEWAKLEYDPNIQAPVIIVIGGRDLQVPPPETAKHAERIIAAGKGDLVALYIFKHMGHSVATAPASVPANLFVDAVHKMDAWIMSGNPPNTNLAGGSSITAGVTAVIPSQPSCGSSGLPVDPMDCLAAVLGDGFVGFCSEDASTACSSDNPTTASLNEDTCVVAGKGSCELVSPFPSECSTF